MAEDLQHYLDLWKLSQPAPLARTATSDVYTVTAPEGPAVLKILTALGRKDEGAGAAALRYFDGHGAVRLFRFDAGAHLLEYASGEDLKALAARGRDEEAAAITGDVLNRLHAQRGSAPEALVPFQRWFRCMFGQAAREKKAGLSSIYTRAAPLAEKLLSAPQEVCVLHGDVHHENIRNGGARGWLALDPKGLYGERLYDAANTLLNPAGVPALVQNEARLLRVAGILAQKMNADLPRLLAFVYAYAALSASWSLEDGSDPAPALAVARLAERHLSGDFAA